MRADGESDVRSGVSPDVTVRDDAPRELSRCGMACSFMSELKHIRSAGFFLENGPHSHREALVASLQGKELTTTMSMDSSLCNQLGNV